MDIMGKISMVKMALFKVLYPKEKKEFKWSFCWMLKKKKQGPTYNFELALRTV